MAMTDAELSAEVEGLLEQIGTLKAKCAEVSDEIERRRARASTVAHVGKRG
jgi:hypothetical protein